MNVENMQRLIAFLKELPDERFTMRVFSEEAECGTVACIAGWAAILAAEERGELPKEGEEKRDAREFLGLSAVEADFFFFGDFSLEVSLGAIKREDAIEALEKALEFGVCEEGRREIGDHFIRKVSR